jgi:hypothetical protein
MRQEMTALNFVILPQEVFIAADTLGRHPETKEPYKYVSKIFLLPHLGGIMCGTGIYQFALDWFCLINTESKAENMIDLDSHTPAFLRALGLKHGLGDESCSTIYHFGYCEEQKRFRAYAYRSERRFRSRSETTSHFGDQREITLSVSKGDFERFSSPGPQKSPFDGLRLTFACIGKREVIFEQVLRCRETDLNCRLPDFQSGALPG